MLTSRKDYIAVVKTTQMERRYPISTIHAKMKRSSLDLSYGIQRSSLDCSFGMHTSGRKMLEQVCSIDILRVLNVHIERSDLVITISIIAQISDLENSYGTEKSGLDLSYGMEICSLDYW